MVFDWNDEELANIIWGDTGQSDDHIVPYPDGSKNESLGLYRDHNKEWEKEGAQVKAAEQKKSGAAIDSNGVKQGLDSQCTAYGMGRDDGLGSRPDFSPSNSSKADINTMCNERLNKATGISNNVSSRSDKEPQPGEDFELCKQPEDKVESDLVKYDWANIGSFDDLDRIFSSNDQMFEHASIGNADESRSSSKNVSSSPEMSASLTLDPSPGFGAILTKPEHFETKAEHMLDQHWPPLGFQKMSNYSCDSTLGAKDSMINFETVVGKSQPIAKAKVNRQGKLLKRQKILPLKGEPSKLQNFYGSCSPYGSQGQQYDNQIAPDMGQPSSSMIYQQKEFLGSEPSPYQKFANPPLIPSSFEVSTSNSNLLNNRLNSSRKILSMTPQEKIAKLRSRQKMRAMVAIQKQEQQFSHQASFSDDNCISPRCNNLVGKREINGSLSVLPSFNQHSSMEQNSSNIDTYSIEDSVLHQLQDVINKLGDQTRLCIRDSLFRLAQSSVQRQHGGDTSITNRGSTDELDVLANEGTSNRKRFVSVSDVETETNPIDRTVAHLLFHRPLDLSDKLAVRESPFPTNLPHEGYEMDSSVHNPCLFTGTDDLKSPYPETSENASNYKTVDCEAIEVKASQ